MKTDEILEMFEDVQIEMVNAEDEFKQFTRDTEWELDNLRNYLEELACAANALARKLEK